MTTAQDQQSRAELLPCPFCGADAFLDDETGWKAVECTACPAHGDVVLDAPDAIAAWNRRAPVEQAARALPASMKPVAWLHINGLGAAQAFTSEPPPGFAAQCAPLYTAAQVQAMGRVPLKDDQVNKIIEVFSCGEGEGHDVHGIARAIEAAHGIKAGP